jgi:hypothetical protein
MSKMTVNRARRVDSVAPGPSHKEAEKIAAEYERALAKVSFVASDYVCRVDFYDAVRAREAKGEVLDIDATVAHYRALDNKPGAIADDHLARVRAHSRESWDAIWQESNAAIYA